MLAGYISVKEASERWKLSPRMIQIYCNEGRINGAAKLGREWAIPTDADKPNDRRLKSGQYVDWRKKEDTIESI